MRARLLRPALGLAALSTAVLALGAQAAPGPVAIEDIAGDANLLNSQILNVPQAGNGTATPGSQAGADIVKVELKNLPAKKGACAGFQMVMTLSGPPAANSRFRLSNNTPKNTRFFIIEHDSGTKESSIRFGGAGEDNTRDLKAVEVKDSTITWTITDKDVKAIGEKAGSVVTLVQATTTYSANGLLFFPIFDKAPATDKTFTICK